MSRLYFTCSVNHFIPTDCAQVRWLDLAADYELAKDYWQAYDQPLSRELWEKAHQYGYQYAAILTAGRIVSSAGVWRFSEDCWEVSAVSTLPGFRRQGLARRAVAFTTRHILDAGRLATCCTGDRNTAMIATAQSVGFQPISEGEVWWTYPQLPDA